MFDALGPRAYARITGPLLILLAIAGYILVGIDQATTWPRVFVFDQAHNHLHLGLGIVALAIGLVREGEYTPWLARVVGPVYVLLGILGFFPALARGFLDATSIHLEAGENLAHMLIGAWGCIAGYLRPAPVIERYDLPDLK